MNNVAANAEQSSTSNPDDPSSPLANTSNQLNRDSSINDDDQHDSNDPEQPTVKPSRGAGASIFGGARPVDTTAKELEIERKLNETKISNTETPADNEEKKPPTQRFDRYLFITNNFSRTLDNIVVVVNVHQMMNTVNDEAKVISNYRQLIN